MSFTVPRAVAPIITESARSMLARLAAGEISALALTEQAIAAIETQDERLNAVVVRDFEHARMQAQAADATLARGERRPLLGLPMTVKEAFDVTGLPTTWGIPAFAKHIAREDAVTVARLKAAGAIILGKTNVATALGDWQSVNRLYGRSANPHDLARTPGGSSGGSAAALAAGMVPLELGSDIGGSIRVPSHFCGIYGHKPSHGLIPDRGHTFPHSAGSPNLFNVVGPMARDPWDLALAFDVLAGPDEDFAVGYRLALPAPRHTRLADFRVLVIEQHPCVDTDAQVRAGVRRIADTLANAGARLLESHRLLPDLAMAQAAYEDLLDAITSRGMTGAPPPIDAHRWLEATDRRHLDRRRWRALFQEVDIVLAPIFGTSAFTHMPERGRASWTLRIDGRDTVYGRQLGWPGLATFPGLPATAVPAGRDTQGLPTGVQLIGPFLEDRTPIALAQLLADAG